MRIVPPPTSEPVMLPGVPAPAGGDDALAHAVRKMNAVDAATVFGLNMNYLQRCAVFLMRFK
jgi:hypothetical protein